MKNKTAISSVSVIIFEENRVKKIKNYKIENTKIILI